jgi:hypothetical protein
VEALVKSATIAILLMGFIPAVIAAQAPESPLHVTACELQRNPQQFEGKLVELRGIVTRGFENFTVQDPDIPLSPNHAAPRSGLRAAATAKDRAVTW